MKKMTDEEILAVYNLGPHAVISLIRDLFNVIEAQNKIIEAQTKRIESLEKRVHELESQSKKNSQNSSKPPSTDIYRKNRSLKEPSDKHTGGQMGHEGHNLSLNDNPDEKVIHKALKCQYCNKPLIGIPVLRTERHQVLEIPEIKLKITEHVCEVKFCNHCSKTTKGLFPTEAKNIVQYGPYAQAFVALSQNYMLIPSERTAEYFSILFDHRISEGTIKNINQRFYSLLEETENKIKDQILMANTIGFDETGSYVDKKQWWLHTSSTSKYTFYAIHPSRGTKAINSIGILPSYTGSVIHDYYRSYLTYTNCFHFLCNVHNLRDLQFIIEQYSYQSWAFEMKTLLKKIKHSVDKAKEKGLELLSPYLLRKYEYLFDKILKKAGKTNPINLKRENIRGKIKQTPSRNLLDRFIKCKDMILGFMYDFNVPFDNNLSERDLRMMKVKQKISGCFRTEQGARFFCRIRGYISTVRKQGYNVLDALLSVIQAKPIINLSY